LCEDEGTLVKLTHETTWKSFTENKEVRFIGAVVEEFSPNAVVASPIEKGRTEEFDERVDVRLVDDD